MSVKYIGVDAGKYSVKAASFNYETEKTTTLNFCTRIAPGDFRDDALAANTYLAEIGGKIYKIGNGARGDGAKLVTSKMDDIHKNCALFAIAFMCDDKSEKDKPDEVNVALGLPAKEWAVVDTREAFKEFMLPNGVIEIKIKKGSNDSVHTKRFTIKKSYVFPESIGALFQDDSPAISRHNYYGVIDLGNLNLNATVWLGTELQEDVSVTGELGAAILAQGLSQELENTFGSRCDAGYVSKLLRKKPEFRYLTPANGNKKIIEESKEVIRRYLLDHAEKIKRACDGRSWSLDYMTLIAIGGTSMMLEKELHEVFGDSLIILKSPVMSNAQGFLRLMCAKLPEFEKYGKDPIPLVFEGKDISEEV